MNPTRVAVVGVGHLGRAHARLLAGRQDAQLVAVVDPVVAQAREVAATHGVSAHTDVAEILGQIDAAIVATPTRSHAAVAQTLMAAGVHVLIEKPIAPSAAEARGLVALARQREVCLQVGHVERFNPAWQAVAGQLHEPKFIEASRTSGFKFRSTDIGVVLDLMIHDLDLVTATVDARLRRVDALGLALFGQHEDVAHARLEFENGCVAVLRASRASYGTSRTMNLWCDEGFAAIDFAARTARVVRPSEQLAARAFDAERLGPSERQHLVDHWQQELFQTSDLEAPPRDQLTAEHDDFLASIQQQRRPQVDGEQALATLELAERILTEIRTHAWDGHSSGRIGPLAGPAPKILRGPHWPAWGPPATPPAEPPRRREAG